MTAPVRFERLERISFERREWFPVGFTRESMTAAMEWVRSLGHEADTLTDDGFRYRSVYDKDESGYITRCNAAGKPCSNWKWVEPGEWLMHMAGDRQDSELDDPHSHGPDDEDFWMPGTDWHRVSEATQ